MTYSFIVFHYPKPNLRDVMIRRMADTARVMSSVDGFVDAGPWAQVGAMISRGELDLLVFFRIPSSRNHTIPTSSTAADDRGMERSRRVQSRHCGFHNRVAT